MPVRALNLYYARDSSVRAEVLTTRLRASAVRAAMGVPRGRVFRRVDGGSDLPDVMWDCPFADAPAHERDMDARAASPRFEAVRAHMRTLTRRFERVLYAFEFSGANSPADETLGTLVAQIWIQRIIPAATEAFSPSAVIEQSQFTDAANVLSRLDANVRLPEWIIETRADRYDDLTAVIESWGATHPQVQTTNVGWEKVG